VETALGNLNLEKFISSKQKVSKALQPLKATGDAIEPISNDESNAFICLCGKMLINSTNTLCDECQDKQLHGTMSGKLFQYDSKENKFTENFCKLEGREILMYDIDVAKQEKPLSIFSLVDCYLFAQGYASLTYKGKSYQGFQLQSSKNMVIFYTEDKVQKEKWITALNAVIKYSSINEFYDMKGMIGKGKYGVVREAVHKQTGIHVAIKGLVKAKMKEEDLEMIRREVDIMRTCQHPNIITLYDFFENDQYVFISI
jgi:hypothetical protein